ncbi:MAG: outer membrane protein assembly factor BamD [Spirochaetales bacterium]|nr:outer membrane protein assembly factor BamD [Spirochaetales bacterium]
MWTKELLFYLSSMMCMVIMPVSLFSQSPEPLKKAEELMQKGLYKDAIIALGHPAPAGYEDYAEYLKAFSHYKNNDMKSALGIIENFERKWKKSSFFHKMRYLHAEIMLAEKDYRSAEKIYSEEALYLLSEGRKKEIAGIYMRYAESLAYQPKPEELDLPKPDYNAAYRFYGEALKLEIADELRDTVKYKMAKMMEYAGNYSKAVSEYKSYLSEFDPAWFSKAISGSADKTVAVKGKYIYDSRLHLSESLIRSGYYLEGKNELHDLITLIKREAGVEALSKPGLLPPEQRKYYRLALRRIPYAFRFPGPSSDFELESGIKSIDEFLSLFPDDSIACTLAWYKAQALINRGRTDEAIRALKDVYEKKGFQVNVSETDEEKTFREEIGISATPEEQFDKMQKEALSQTGNLYFKQRKFETAVRIYSDYISRFPNGPHWTSAQQGIIDAEYQMGIDKINEKNYAEAEKIWNAFLINHPLDVRSRQILFTLAQIQYQQGLDVKEKARDSGSDEFFRNAIAGFRKLVAKYPNTNESSLAQLRIGEILEREIKDFEAALKAYKMCNWGNYAYEASQRVNQMVNKELTVKTERIFRTNEKALLKVQVRNIEKLKLSTYKLNLEAYFRKFHGITGVENLDLALIEPDSVSDVAITGYKPYLPLEQELEIPMKGPGVYAVNVAGTDLEATTLVIRSNIDLILKSSRDELLVFVQDRLANKPVSGASVLVTDGNQVILEGKTGGDGVLREKLKELVSVNSLNAFVENSGSIAATGLNMAGLGFSRGLAPKGYIFTDRPAYRPGETIQIKGIVRDVSSGSYVVPGGKPWKCRVLDPEGRYIYQEELPLSEFGTVNTGVNLSADARRGSYTMQVTNEDQSLNFNGTFLVEDFKLEKIKLTLDFDRNVYFRGETIKAVFGAEYYFGQPVAGHDFSYTTPDGLQHFAKTDEQGKFTVEFDSLPFNAGQNLAFTFNLTGENVVLTRSAFLAAQEFTLALSTLRNVVLADSPVEVSVKSRDASGKATSREVEVIMIKRVSETIDPLFLQIPWLKDAVSNVVTTYNEVEIEKKAVKTSEDGTAHIGFTPPSGGDFLFRARSRDRFDNVITAEIPVFVSDETDETLLRFFPSREHYKVGEKDNLMLSSLLKEPTMALVCFEGEGIISYSLLTLDKKKINIPLNIGHEHFPNFTIDVSCMSGNRLIEASVPFTVERELYIKITPDKNVFAPADKGEIDIQVKDHLGKPVLADFSLALVNEALLALYADPLPDIVAFFQEGAFREAKMVTTTSCTFAYSPITREVLKEIAEEDERVKKEEEKASSAKKDKGPEYTEDELSDIIESENFYAEEALEGESLKTEKPIDTKEREKKGLVEETPREEMPSRGYWIASVKTGKDGRAKVPVPIPEASGSFRIIIKGCTQETLVGQADTSITVRKDFFVSLKTPSLLQEEDEVRFVGRIHNVSSYSGPVNAVLSITADGKKTTLAGINVIIKPNETREIVFAPYAVPFASSLRLVCDVDAPGSHRDSVLVNIPVRPWGLPFSVTKSGTADNDTTVFVSLDEEKEYGNRWMSIALQPPVDESIIDMVINADRPYGIDEFMDFTVPFVRGPESDLLALVSVLRYIQGSEAPPELHADLKKRISDDVSALVSTQDKDGSWKQSVTGEEIAVTSTAYWALILAGKAGIEIDLKAIERAKTYLKNQFTALPQDDNEKKAMILNSLSLSGDADYTFVNRLYRNRNELSEAALAFTALTLAALDKKDMGLELLSLLLGKSQAVEIDPGTGVKRTVRRWSGSGNHPWLANPVESTALALLAFQALKPADGVIGEGVEYLLSVQSSGGFSPAKSIGYVSQALCRYYGKTRSMVNDYTVQITVNGKAAGKYTLNAATGERERRQVFSIPFETVSAGENKVQFKYSGRGEYRYLITLTGFSKDLKDPASWDYPKFNYKKYIHEPLRYKGRTIGSSSQVITQLETTQTATVHIDFNSGYSKSYLVLEEFVPSGAVVLKDTLKGSQGMVEFQDNKILFYFKPNQSVSYVTYTIASYTPGRYKVLPPVLRSAFSPGEMRIGTASELTLLAPSEKSTDPYKMNEGELYGLGKEYFEDNDYGKAVELLEELYAIKPQYNQRDLARMLLWIRTAPGHFDAARVVEYFEILKEKYPELNIPFEKILAVGKAYEEIGEFERSYLVYKAIIDASFAKDAVVGGNLERSQEVIGSVEYMTNLIAEYPDSSPVSSAFFALSQAVYSYAPEADTITSRIHLMKDEKKREKITRQMLLERASNMFWKFMTYYPSNELLDDAAFTMLNIYLDRKEYDEAVSLSRSYQKTYNKSSFYSNYQYMEALSQFSLRRYKEAIDVAKKVAEGKSEDKNLATYILGQIYHSQRKPEESLKYYKMVSEEFPDAREAIAYFEKKSIGLDEVSIFTPGEKIDLTLKYRNIKEVNLQVYKVDLMKLYLREKNLSKITQINLSGITPALEKALTLGLGKDYEDRDKTIDLPLRDEGAYLVVCRGDDLFASGLVLITPLTLEVQEDAASGRVRVNVFDKVRKIYPDTVHVKVIGTNNTQFISGDTDLRGILIADGINGVATVIARDKKSRYAFYRGILWLGPRDEYFEYEAEEQKQEDFDTKYRGNLYKTQELLQEKNRASLDDLYEQDIQGVQVNEAF